MDNMILITTTVEKKEDAILLAKELLNKRLIGCAQIDGPIESLYWWQGTIEQEPEYRLSVKSIESKWDAIKATIEAKHPYDVPEIIATPVIKENEGYKKWLLEELRK